MGAGERIDYAWHFPWIRLFHAFRFARDVRKLILVAVGLTLVSLGDQVFLHLPFAPDPAPEVRLPWRQLGTTVEPAVDRASRVAANAGMRRELYGAAGPIQDAAQFTQHPVMVSLAAFANGRTVLAPFSSLVEPAAALFRLGNTWSQCAYAWTRLLWALIVWAVFGGAVTRMAAVEAARGTTIGTWQALRFACRRFLSYLAAPLMPLAAIGVLWGVLALGGLIGRIPAAGDEIIAGLYGLGLVIGFIATLLVMGAAAGWPLMYAGVSVEGSDAFDGFSRAYSYVFSKPWHYLWNVLVAVVYGSAILFFVALLAALTTHLTAWGVSAGMGAERFSELAVGAGVGPAAIPADSQSVGAGETGAAAASLANSIVNGWMSLVTLLMTAFTYSYFWCASTIIYLLLRKSDDATALDEVYFAENEEEDDLMPLVGTADSDAPVVERPHKPIANTATANADEHPDES